MQHIVYKLFVSRSLLKMNFEAFPLKFVPDWVVRSRPRSTDRNFATLPTSF